MIHFGRDIFIEALFRLGCSISETLHFCTLRVKTEYREMTTYEKLEVRVNL